MYSFVAGQREVWPKIEELGKAPGKKIGAIAYLHDISRTKFRKGDILIIDASDRAIKQGLTVASEIARLSKSVHLYSFPGLHAKTLIVGDLLITGSMNASKSSREVLTESALITDDEDAVHIAREWLHSLMSVSTPIDKTFVARIAKIKVAKVLDGPTNAKNAPSALARFGSKWHYLWCDRSGFEGAEIESAEERLEELQEVEEEANSGLLVDMLEFYPNERFFSRMKRGDHIFVAWAPSTAAHPYKTRVMNESRVRDVKRTKDMTYVYYTYKEGADNLRSCTLRAFQRRALKHGVNVKDGGVYLTIRSASKARNLNDDWPVRKSRK
jgi:hypothetical protein